MTDTPAPIATPEEVEQRDLVLKIDHAANAWYIAPPARMPPPYVRQTHIEAIVDWASDGSFAGLEIVWDTAALASSNAETTHPTDLDTLLKEEPNWVERATEMVVRRCDARTSGVDRLGLIADLAERFEADYAVLLTQVRGLALLREGVDERNDLKNRLRAAEASLLTARRDALEEAAKVADREQDECAEHEDNAFADSVAARWSAAADAAHRIAAGIRTLASTVPGGEETGA